MTRLYDLVDLQLHFSLVMDEQGPGYQDLKILKSKSFCWLT